MKTIKSQMAAVSLLATAMFFSQNCQSQTQAPTDPAGAVAGAGSIKGKAAFAGTAPVMAKLKRNADPFCGKTPMNDQEVVVNPNGTLKNVVIRISAGAAPAAMPPMEPIHMDQVNCMYSPRVVGGVANQKLIIRNSDPVLHNVHTYVGATTGFNQAQMKGSKDMEKTVAAGVMKFKCDVHPWMTGYVVGNDNPFVAVTGDSGEVVIANVPAGTYTVEAWHEKYGTKTAQVTVAAGQAAADFSFSAQ